MFGGLKNLAGMASMMSQAGDIKAKVAEAKERIGRLEVEGSAGAVTVRLKGDLRVVGVEIQQSLIDAQDRALMEQLVSAAMSDAIQKAKTAAAKEISDIAQDLNIPGLQDFLSKLP